MSWRKVLACIVLAVAGCKKPEAPPPPPRPNILLVTLDTTRADAVGPEQHNAETPAFNALAARGVRFRQAYATVPQTLPSHTSMLTGLYPAGHGVHENARYVAANQVVVAERLHNAGYRTAAFVSAFALARRFGLARGFDVYDDETPKGVAERSAKETTDRALAFLRGAGGQPLFLWVHYYDPHFPYTPPEPYRSRYATKPYYGEVASMDEQLGRLIGAWQGAVIVVGDHGEGLGEHGEAQHGNLLYQATMHVPLLLVGPGVKPAVNDAPVSTRRVFHTILDWAGIDATNSLRGKSGEVVAGEAMQPFLEYGWQPQVMALEGRQKAVLAGRVEVYDVVADPAEMHDLDAQANLSRETRATLRDYPVPSPQAASSEPALTDEERRKLAALGYITAVTKPVIRAGAPRPADMAPLFGLIEEASELFVREQYAECIPLFEKVLAKDPHNLDAALRVATAHSALGHEQQAVAAFERAQQIAPESRDVRVYLALHYARGKEWQRAAPLLESIVAGEPNRLPALEALAVVREKQGRIDEAVGLLQQIYAMRSPSQAELVRLGEMAMAIGKTGVAIDAFERAHAGHELELGVLYLAARRLEDARAALDRVPPNSPYYPMALFKRAQVAVLLHEPDAQRRIEAARAHADATTKRLIERERLFR